MYLLFGTGGTGLADGSFVTVYKWNGAEWKTKGNTIQGADKSFFRYSLSLSSDGNILAIGAVLFGFAEVYEWNGNEWILRCKRITTSSPSRQSWFGHSVELTFDGNILVIAAVKELNAKGRVYVYDWNGSEYILRSTINGLRDGN